jgi:hypothetical protein
MGSTGEKLMAETRTHWNVTITVTRVDHIPVKTEPVYSGQQRRDAVVESKRIVTVAGHVEIKNTDFEAARELAGKHLDLLTEFEGTDPRKGTTRGEV